MDKISYRKEKAKDGNPTLIVNIEGKELPLHSRVSPLREAQRGLPLEDGEKYDLLIVLGCGLGYSLIPLSEQISGYKRVVIVDILEGIEKMISKSDHTSFLVKSENIRIISGRPLPDLLNELDGIIDLEKYRGIKVIDHPGSVRIFSEYYGAVREFIRQSINRAGRNMATVRAFGRLFLRNALLNTSLFEKMSPVLSLEGRFAGMPAVIISSAPSAWAYMKGLVRFRDNMALIAVDSALPVLRSHGLEPDFAVSIDPQHRIGEHFLGHKGSGTAHVFSIVSVPRLASQYGGFLSLNSHPVSQIIEKFFPRTVGSADSGTGSVAGDALAFALLCGFGPVYMAGFDFSFSGNTIYARGSAYQNRYALFFNSRLATPESFNADYIFKSSRSLVCEGLYTRRSFTGYRDSLNEYIGRKDAPILFPESGGLRVSNAGAADFNSFLESACLEPVRGRVREITAQAKERKISENVDRKVLASVMNDRKFLDELLEVSLGSGDNPGGQARLRKYLVSSGISGGK